MRKMILLVGAAAIAATAPTVAASDPGKGNSARSAHARGHGDDRVVHRTTRDRTRSGVRVDRRLDSDRDGIPDIRDRIDNRRVDSDRDGIPDFRDRFDDRRGNRYGGAACPPGLANRNPACVPPGQARRMFRQGQIIPSSYRDYLAYQDLLGRLPENYRDDIPLGDYRYIYQNDQVYVVDPRTRLVRRIIDILR